MIFFLNYGGSSKIFGLLCISHGNSNVLISRKQALGYILGDFFTNLSGLLDAESNNLLKLKFSWIEPEWSSSASRSRSVRRHGRQDHLDLGPILWSSISAEKKFPINFQPQILNKFRPQKAYKFIWELGTITKDFKEF
jgi:hypothetical protein